jgi:hypothetical protein
VGTNVALSTHLAITSEGGRWLDEMEQFYKNHRIEISVWLDGDEWFVGLYIYYQVERTNTLVTFSLEGKFTTYDEAVKAGLEAAQQWIDRKMESGSF